MDSFITHLQDSLRDVLDETSFDTINVTWSKYDRYNYSIMLELKYNNNKFHWGLWWDGGTSLLSKSIIEDKLIRYSSTVNQVINSLDS